MIPDLRINPKLNESQGQNTISELFSLPRPQVEQNMLDFFSAPPGNHHALPAFTAEIQHRYKIPKIMVWKLHFRSNIVISGIYMDFLGFIG